MSHEVALGGFDDGLPGCVILTHPAHVHFLSGQLSRGHVGPQTTIRIHH